MAKCAGLSIRVSPSHKQTNNSETLWFKCFWCFWCFVFVVTESSTGPIKRFKEMIVAHVGGHAAETSLALSYPELCRVTGGAWHFGLWHSTTA
jgi:hypothetical protein